MKSSTETSGTTRLDPYSESYRQHYLDQGRNALDTAAPIDSTGGYQAAHDIYGRAVDYGRLGLGALSGDQGDISGFMNPYMQNVMDPLRTGYDRLRTMGANDVNSQAQGAGAFGGSRNGVALAERMNGLDRQQMDQEGGLLYGGYNDAMARARDAAGMGMGASGTLMQLDEQKRLENYNRAMMGGQLFGQFPYGQDSTSKETKTDSPLKTALGLGMMAGSFFVPGAGAAAGGMSGLMSGMGQTAQNMQPFNLPSWTPPPVNYGPIGQQAPLGSRGSFR